MTCLLAIDTATRHATVAVATSQEPEAPVVSRAWFSQHNHGVELLAKVTEALTEAGRATSDITHIAVVTGPGSFSALRVGLSTAQGMALANDIEILSVPTLELEAEPYRDQTAPVCAVVDAGSSGVAWGLFDFGGESPGQIESGVDPVDDCVAARSDDTVFCGEAVGRLTEHVTGDRILSGEAPTRGAEALVRVALRKLDSGEGVDPSKAEIAYARAPAISTPRERLPDGSRPQKAR